MTIGRDDVHEVIVARARRNAALHYNNSGEIDQLPIARCRLIKLPVSTFSIARSTKGEGGNAMEMLYKRIIEEAGTANMWDSDIAARGLAMKPFGWGGSSLVEATFTSEVLAYRGDCGGTLLSQPTSVSEAVGAAASYLSGSAKWHAWKTTEDVRKSADFKKLGVSDCRKKAARELKDLRLSQRSVGFVHQAARYRGKANYREALFLAYGKSTETILKGFVAEQAFVLRAF